MQRYVLIGNEGTEMKATIKSWKANESAETVLKVHQAQIQQLYRQSWVGLAGTFTVALGVCIANWQAIPHWKLLLWFIIFCLLTIARSILIISFQNKSPSGPAIYPWARRHVLSTIAAALMWGLPALLLWPGDSAVHQLVWSICIISITAAAVARYSTWIPSYVPFLAFSAIPIALRLLFEGGLEYIILGMLGLIFTAILAQTGKMMHAASLEALLVGFRNETLSAFLEKEKTIAEDLNAKLKQEISERKRSQGELRLRNQDLEELNSQLTTTKSRLESTNEDLEGALANVKQLSGMLPICSSCKKIRNDKGYWEQIDRYIHDHSEAEFSHGICPECVEKLYPQYGKKK